MTNNGVKRKRKRREKKSQSSPVHPSRTSSSSSAASTSTISNTSTQPQPAVREIPGYTWDSEKKRYFKIMATGAAPSHHPFSEGNLRAKEKAEVMRLREMVRRFCRDKEKLEVDFFLVQIGRSRGAGHGSCSVDDIQREETRLLQRKSNGAFPFLCAREIGLQRTCRGFVCDVKHRLGRSLKRVGAKNYLHPVPENIVDMQIHPHRNEVFVGEESHGFGQVRVLSYNACKNGFMTTTPICVQLMRSQITSLSLGPSDTVISTYLGGAGEAGSVHITIFHRDYRTVLPTPVFKYSPIQTSVWANDVNERKAVIGASRQAIVISGWDGRNASPAIARLHTGSDVLSVALEKSSGQKLVAGCRDGTIRIFDLRSPQHTPSFHGIVPGMKHKSSIYSVTPLRNGWGVLCAAKDGSINLWDIRSAGYRDDRSGRTAGPVTEYMDTINEHQKLGLCVDDDETMFLAAGNDSRIRGYSLRSAGAQCHPFLTTKKSGGTVSAVRWVGRNRSELWQEGARLKLGEGLLAAVNTFTPPSDLEDEKVEGCLAWWAG